MSTFPLNRMHHFGVAAATLFAIRPSPFPHPMGMFTCTLEPQHYESLRASLFLVLFLAYRLGFASCSYHIVEFEVNNPCTLVQLSYVCC